MDLAETLPIADLVALGDSALRGAATHGQMREMLQRARRRRGVIKARHVFELLDTRSESRPESHLRYALCTAGLPPPAVNEPITDADGQWLCVPDLSYEDARLALEYNGADHFTLEHGRRDITRAFDVEDRGGWRILTFGPAEVFGRPHQVASHVRHVRDERLAQLRTHR